MARAVLLVMDSVGIGGAPDAARSGDAGRTRWGTSPVACALGEADRPGVRNGMLRVPKLARLGLNAAAALSTGAYPPGFDARPAPDGCWGVGRPVSRGKDTISGPRELAGLPVPFA